VKSFRSLGKQARTNPRKWDEFLQATMFGLRTKKTINHTAFPILFNVWQRGQVSLRGAKKRRGKWLSLFWSERVEITWITGLEYNTTLLVFLLTLYIFFNSGDNWQSWKFGLEGATISRAKQPTGNLHKSSKKCERKVTPRSVNGNWNVVGRTILMLGTWC